MSTCNFVRWGALAAMSGGTLWAALRPLVLST